MTVPDFLAFVTAVATAVRKKVKCDEHTILGALAADDDGFLTMCLTLWGVMKGARHFSFLFASIPNSRMPMVIRALSKYGLDCTSKRQTFGDKQVAFFVYARGSSLGRKVSEALAATPDGSTATFSGTAMDDLIGKALGYPVPTESNKAWASSSRGAAMTWSIEGTKLAGRIYTFSLIRNADTEVRKAEKLWKSAMRKIHPSINCSVQVGI